MADRAASGDRRAHSFERAAAFLAAHGLADQIVHFEEGATRTSEDAASALGCELGQVVKSLVFVADGTPLLALVAGDRRGDAPAIAELLGASDVRLAPPDVVRLATGYAVGGVSPFDLPEALAVVVDDSLARFDILYAAAGTPQTMVGLERCTLLELSGGAMARISR